MASTAVVVIPFMGLTENFVTSTKIILKKLKRKMQKIQHEFVTKVKLLARWRQPTHKLILAA